MRAAIALGRLEDAASWSEHLSAPVERMPLPATAIRAQRARAEVLLARGDAAAAAELARAAATAELPEEELAARLLLKTVENHLSRVYAKLGVRSRGELIARLGAGV